MELEKHRRYKSAAYRLFHFVYTVDVPQIAMYSVDYIQKMGYSVTGDTALDRLRLNQVTTIKQTPAGMAVLMGEGFDVGFKNSSEVIRIYSDIQQHLRDWEQYAFRGMYVEDVPIEDLRRFEAVALKIHRDVMFHMPLEDRSSGVRRGLVEFQRRRNPTMMDRQLRGQLMDDYGNLRPMVSIVDRIERQLLGE